MALSDRDREVLDFERSWQTRAAGAPKAVVVRSTLQMSPSAYYRRLALLVGTDEAMAYDPLLVRRLRQRRLARLRRRWLGNALPTPGAR
jgi:hypothetical protein